VREGVLDREAVAVRVDAPDPGSQERPALVHVAAGQQVAHPLDVGDDGALADEQGARPLSPGAQGRLAGVELVAARLPVADARSEDVQAQHAFVQRVEVARERPLGLGGLGLHAGQFVLGHGALALQLLVDQLDQLGQVLGRQHQPRQFSRHGLLGPLGVEQLGVAGRLARLQLRLAAVVVRLARLRGVPDEPGAAARAIQQPGQQVAPSQPARVDALGAALRQHHLDPGEVLGRHQGLVGAGHTDRLLGLVGLAAVRLPPDPDAGVDLVAQDVEHALLGPRLVASGPVTCRVEARGDGLGALSGQRTLEDAPDQRRELLIGLEHAPDRQAVAGLLDAVTRRSGPAVVVAHGGVLAHSS
jgi:hypothetical protein